MTRQQKTHYEVLDGLRGTAALSVLLFHILEITAPDLARNPLRHAHLAVDFFFALSGFVLGHAYDARMSTAASTVSQLSLKGFFVRRLVRLHPMVILSMILGLLAFVLDPYDGSGPGIGTDVSMSTLVLVFGLSLLLLPSPSLPNRFGETHSLNGPAWTLFQEYLANLAYGLFAHRLSNRTLGVVCAISAVAVLLTALHFGHLGTGWAYPAVYVFAHWKWHTNPPTEQLWLVSTALCVGIIFLAWLLLKYCDEPIRDYLGRKLTGHSGSHPIEPPLAVRSASSAGGAPITPA